MAALPNIGGFFSSWFSHSKPERQGSGAKALADRAYQRTGGATPELKRVLEAFAENERRRKQAQSRSR